MHLEIERRFLVEQNKLPTLRNGKLLTQGYLSKLSSPTGVLVRIRTTKGLAYLTIKLFKSTITKQEFEYKIPIKDAEHLLAEAYCSIQKIRYHLKIGGHVWSVDVYEGENFPLVVAEIELKSETEDFEKPLWLKKEVSNDPRFHAYNLALKPFSKW